MQANVAHRLGVGISCVAILAATSGAACHSRSNQERFSTTQSTSLVDSSRSDSASVAIALKGTNATFASMISKSSETLLALLTLEDSGAAVALVRSSRGGLEKPRLLGSWLSIDSRSGYPTVWWRSGSTSGDVVHLAFNSPSEGIAEGVLIVYDANESRVIFRDPRDACWPSELSPATNGGSRLRVLTYVVPNETDCWDRCDDDFYERVPIGPFWFDVQSEEKGRWERVAANGSEAAHVASAYRKAAELVRQVMGDECGERRSFIAAEYLRLALRADSIVRLEIPR